MAETILRKLTAAAAEVNLPEEDARIKKHLIMVRNKSQRTCVACGSKSDKSALLRLVRTNHGPEVDIVGKTPGRGAYLCYESVCMGKPLSRERIAATLKCTITDLTWSKLVSTVGSKRP